MNEWIDRERPTIETRVPHVSTRSKYKLIDYIRDIDYTEKRKIKKIIKILSVTKSNRPIRNGVQNKTR